MADKSTFQSPDAAFQRDFDGQGNATSPEAQAAAAAAAGNTTDDVDSLTEEDFDALMGETPEGEDNGEEQEAEEGQETADDAEGSDEEEPAEEGSFEERLANSPTMKQVGNALNVLAQGIQRVAAPQDTPPTDEEANAATETSAKTKLKRDNPTLDEEGIDWLYRNNLTVAQEANAPLVARLDVLEGRSNKGDMDKQVQQFYNQLDTHLSAEMPQGEDEDDEAYGAVRRLVRESVVARFTANPQLQATQLKAVVKEVKSDFNRVQSTTDNGRRKKLKAKEGTPPSPGKKGRTGTADLLKKATVSKRKNFDFGQPGSSRIVKDIISRVSIND